jgi:hypothetical protein
MKTLTFALVLTLSLVCSETPFGLGEASAGDELSYYCVVLRPCASFRNYTTQIYSWFDKDQLEVGDFVLVSFFDKGSNQLTCQKGQLQNWIHRTYLLSSCTGSTVSSEGWMYFNSDHDGEKFEIMSIDHYE